MCALQRICVLLVAAAGLGACQYLGMPAPRPGADGLLEAFAPPTPAQAAAWFGDESNADNRYRGAVLLANAWFAGENDAYLQGFSDYLMNDPDPSIRAVCARGLGNHAGPEYAPVLATAMRTDDDVQVRVEAARALQRIHNPGVIDELIAACREPLPGAGDVASEAQADVRVEAARALGQYADPFVVDALIGALDDSSLVVHRAALRSLTTLTGQNFGHDTVAWMRWRRSTKNIFAARAVYQYPVFSRDKLWWEYVPLVPAPPNEEPARPVGMPHREG